MLSFLETLYSVVVAHLRELVFTAVAISTAALAAYWREQARSGTEWIMSPLTRSFPWNTHAQRYSKPRTIFTSDFTLIDLYLIDPVGKHARYQKTSRFVVTTDEVSSYNEGVAADGSAAGFLSMRGRILETTREHGFHISHIDLGETLNSGSRFTNTYCADLLNCFTASEEQWSQELAFPTKHLGLRVHFPKCRPPKSVRCKTIEIEVDQSEVGGEDGPWF